VPCCGDRDLHMDAPMTKCK